MKNKKWYYKKMNDNYLQTAYNNTLITKLNKINKSIINEKDVILVGYTLKNLFESLIWLNKPIIKYRYDNEHSIYINNIKLRVENYEYNHQRDEEWIESQKNIFLNLDSSVDGIYPKKMRNKESFVNDLNGLYTSGRIINDGDIIYCGILLNSCIGNTLIYFHIDELKSDNPIYKYSSKNNENISLHPYLCERNLNKEFNKIIIESPLYGDDDLKLKIENKINELLNHKLE